MIRTTSLFVTNEQTIRPVQDGKTRFYIDIPYPCDLNKLTITICANLLTRGSSGGGTIDWGDGATTSLYNLGDMFYQHNYSSHGYKTITMTLSSGWTMKLGHNKTSEGLFGSTEMDDDTYRGVLRGFETGTGVTALTNYCCQRHTSLKTVIFGEDLTSIGTYAFRYCYGLGSMYFLRNTTPYAPSVGNSAAWGDIPVWCKIWTKKATSNYYNTTNYPSNSVYTYAQMS